MAEESNEFDYENLKKRGTGSHDEAEEYKVIEYPFGRYIIRIKLTPTNQFIGIIEVSINKEFIAYKEKIERAGVHEVEEFYKEE